MPSWGVHLGIANKVLKNIDNIDKNLFMFGNVTPDINNGYVIKNVSKIIAHKITHYDGEKDFKGYRRFYIKYAKYIQDPVILGSLTHLMTDYYYNNITYTKKAIWDEQKESIIGVKLNNGKQIKCNKEELRKLKRNDFRIYADYVYKNSKFEDLKFDEKILSVNQIVDEFDITKKESEETIQYINKYINGEKFIIDMCEKHEYLMYTKQEMENMEKECVQFITEFLKRIKNIIIGKTAGFCYGVKRAVDGVNKDIKENKEDNIYCLGEIVHNRQVINSLKEKGLIFIDDIEDAKGKTVIRAHGIRKEIYDLANKKGIELKDYTCPNVLKIHKIAEEYAGKGFFIFLCGSKEHPENIGTISYCGKNVYVIEKEDDVEEALEILKNSNINKLLIISQTTYSLEKFNEIEKRVKSKLPKNIELILKNTICKATELRQNETEKISKMVDYMIIIGGVNSSNTKKLYEIAKVNCKKCICVETAVQLDIAEIEKSNKVGIMAGASTPEESIQKILEKVEKIIEI